MRSPSSLSASAMVLAPSSPAEEADQVSTSPEAPHRVRCPERPTTAPRPDPALTRPAPRPSGSPSAARSRSRAARPTDPPP